MIFMIFFRSIEMILVLGCLVKEEVSDRTWVSKCFLFGGVIFAFRKFLKW